MLFVVVFGGVNIDNGMNKAQDESLSGPVDDDIHSHVVLVEGNFVHIRERCGSATEAQFPTDAGKT